MRDQRVEQFGRGFLFLSTLALTLTAPFHSDLSSECDKECFSLIQSTKAFLSLMMAVLFGMTSDIIKPEDMLFCLSIVNLFVNIITISTTGSFMLIALSIFSSSSINQSYVLLRALYSQTWDNDNSLSDVSKAHRFGQLGSTLSLSCIIGPLIGSYIFGSFQDAVYMTSTLLLICIYVAYQLSVSSQAMRKKRTVDSTTKKTLSVTKIKSSFQSLQTILLSPEVLLLLALKFCMAVSYGLFLPVWRESLLHTFHFSPQNHSVYLGLIAMVYAFCQRFLASRILSMAGQHQDYLLVFCVMILSVGRVVLVQTTSLLVVAVVMIGLVTALMTTNTLVAIACTNLSQKTYIGSVYSLLDFTESLAGLLIPLISAVLLPEGRDKEAYTFRSLCGVCVSYLCFSLLVLKFFNHYFIHPTPEVTQEKKMTQKLNEKRGGKKHKRTKSPTSVVFFKEDIEAVTAIIKLCPKKHNRDDQINTVVEDRQTMVAKEADEEKKVKLD